MKLKSIKYIALIFTVIFALTSSAGAQEIFDKVKNKVKEQTDKVKEQTGKVKQETDSFKDQTADVQNEIGKVKTTKNGDAKNEKSDKTDDKSSKADAKLYGFVYINVRVKGKFGKMSSRTYVSEIVPVSSSDYKKYLDDSSHDLAAVKGHIWKYFASTVVAAAKERGEEIEEPYDGSINYKYNIYNYSEGNRSTVRYHPLSYLEEPRQGEIDHAKNSGRPAYFFRWDPSGRNTEADLAKEKNRGNSRELPNQID